MSSQRRDSFFVKHCKKLFSDRNPSPYMRTEFSEHTTFLVETTLFKSKRTGKLLLTVLDQ